MKFSAGFLSNRYNLEHLKHQKQNKSNETIKEKILQDIGRSIHWDWGVRLTDFVLKPRIRAFFSVYVSDKVIVFASSMWRTIEMRRRY